MAAAEDQASFRGSGAAMDVEAATPPASARRQGGAEDAGQQAMELEFAAASAGERSSRGGAGTSQAPGALALEDAAPEAGPTAGDTASLEADDGWRAPRARRSAARAAPEGDGERARLRTGSAGRGEAERRRLRATRFDAGARSEPRCAARESPGAG